MKPSKRLYIILPAVLIFVLAILTGGEFVLKMLFPTTYSDIIYEVSHKHETDPYLVLALIKAESNFVSDAQSIKDAVGLMQITEPTAQWIAEKTDFVQYSFDRVKNPEVNIAMGTWYLSYLTKLYDGNEKLALCAYNAGRGNVDKWLENASYSADGENLDMIPFPETDSYIRKIERYKQVYLKLYPNLFDR